MPDNGLHVSGGGGGIGSWSIRAQWMLFAVASGACAAFNGVFAKLSLRTTTTLTTNISKGIAGFVGLSSMEGAVEVFFRALYDQTFFALNLAFNAVMWSLFTTALAKGTSTTQVSIMNTSANFILTAFLGSIIFSESLPGMWWAGAALLVIGNVIIGRKDESSPSLDEAEGGSSVPAGSRGDGYAPVATAADEDVVDLGDLTEDRR
ncbi:hypothetical protein GMORB2_4073 [Geosmithia morbida]|uniref:EamA domain-containing protein n=1 Tax=Geosmithia morbida TaxID=1094350 RepID=A0A9P4Z234_9HYPO|nr:uncharacterized protein GMORB2_4073 [Geosmithia morbida]KAF4125234.1 hypothetical protein GMORB2_4073 [Geosmithia morbida]